MTGRPYGGAPEPPDDQENLPGERPEEDAVTAAPEQSPRAAEGEWSDQGSGVPGSATGPSSAGPPDSSRP